MAGNKDIANGVYWLFWVEGYQVTGQEVTIEGNCSEKIEYIETIYTAITHQ